MEPGVQRTPQLDELQKCVDKLNTLYQSYDITILFDVYKQISSWNAQEQLISELRDVILLNIESIDDLNGNLMFGKEQWEKMSAKCRMLRSQPVFTQVYSFDKDQIMNSVGKEFPSFVWCDLRWHLRILRLLDDSLGMYLYNDTIIENSQIEDIRVECIMSIHNQQSDKDIAYRFTTCWNTKKALGFDDKILVSDLSQRGFVQKSNTISVDLKLRYVPKVVTCLDDKMGQRLRLVIEHIRKIQQEKIAISQQQKSVEIECLKKQIQSLNAISENRTSSHNVEISKMAKQLDEQAILSQRQIQSLQVELKQKDNEIKQLKRMNEKLNQENVDKALKEYKEITAKLTQEIDDLKKENKLLKLRNEEILNTGKRKREESSDPRHVRKTPSVPFQGPIAYLFHTTQLAENTIAKNE